MLKRKKNLTIRKTIDASDFFQHFFRIRQNIAKWLLHPFNYKQIVSVVNLTQVVNTAPPHSLTSRE